MTTRVAGEGDRPAAVDVVVVGGGFFGLYLAAHLRDRFRHVWVCEREETTFQRASYVNQARVHNGYHYPRSLLTALRSRASYPRFCREFSGCLDRSFQQVYAIARRGSKVTGQQYERFMQRIGAPIRQASAATRHLFDPDLVSAVYEVEECAFDATRLQAEVERRLLDRGVSLYVGTEVVRVRSTSDDRLRVTIRDSNGSRDVTTRHVLHCTYAGTNHVLKASEVPLVRLKHEVTEMALFEPPAELEGRGVTLMCGPFFSCMPFPAAGLFSLSHVRYTPHREWHEVDDAYPERARAEAWNNLPSRHAVMFRDAARYLPALRRGRYVQSLWDIKTTLPRNEVDDGRPILFRPDHGFRGNHVVLGGKIDNVYDVALALDRLFQSRRTTESISVHETRTDAFVSLILPAPNADGTTATLVEAACALLEEKYTNYEVVMVTGPRLPTALSDSLAAVRCGRVIRLSRAPRFEIGMLAGLDTAVGDIVVVARPGHDPLSTVPALVERVHSGSAAAIGVTSAKQQGSWAYRLGRRFFYALASLVIGWRPVPHVTTTGLCALSRHVVNALTRVRRRERPLDLMLDDLGFCAARVEYEPLPDKEERRRVLSDGINRATAVLFYRPRKLLRIAGGVGLLGAVLSASYVGYVVAIYLWLGQVAPGWTTLSLQISGLFTLLFLSLFLLGETTARLLDETIDEPLYHIVDEKSSTEMLAQPERPNVLATSADPSPSLPA